MIEISHARANNLKNISLKIPRDKLIVIAGVSGSGKSSEQIVMETLERNLLKIVKEDMIKTIAAIKTTEEMKEFALKCAKALLNDYERDLKNKKCNKKK